MGRLTTSDDVACLVGFLHKVYILLVINAAIVIAIDEEGPDCVIVAKGTRDIVFVDVWAVVEAECKLSGVAAGLVDRLKYAGVSL